MSVVDYFLNALIKRLKKAQKERKKRKKKKVSKKKTKAKRLSRKTSRKSSQSKKKALSKIEKHAVLPKKRKIARESPSRLKAKRVKKNKKRIAEASKNRISPREVRIGEITHFFPNIQVVVLKMTKGKLLIGDQIHIKGRGCDFIQKVKSLQIESVDVKAARKGQLAGLKVNQKVQSGAGVFKLVSLNGKGK